MFSWKAHSQFYACYSGVLSILWLPYYNNFFWVKTLLLLLFHSIKDFQFPEHLSIPPNPQGATLSIKLFRISLLSTKVDLLTFCMSLLSLEKTVVSTNSLLSYLKENRSFTKQLNANCSWKPSCSPTVHWAPEWLVPFTSWLPKGNASSSPPSQPLHHGCRYTSRNQASEKTEG